MNTVQEQPPETLPVEKSAVEVDVNRRAHDAPSTAEQEMAQEANQQAVSLLGEFRQFVRESGKWWLVPVLISLLAVAAFVVLGSSGLSPFLYTLF